MEKADSIKKIIQILCFIFACIACSNMNSRTEPNTCEADSLYTKVHDYMCRRQLSEGLAFVNNQLESPDVFILRAYLQLYSSDSLEICTLLDSAWNYPESHEATKLLSYRRYVTSAIILTSETVKDFNRAISFAQKSIDLCEKEENIGTVCENANLMGMIYFHTGSIVKSVKAYQSSLEMVEKNEGDRTAEIQAYLGLAALFHKWARKKTELEYAQKAMSIVLNNPEIDVYTVCVAARRTGIAFEINNEPDSALYYYRRAYEVSVTSGMSYYAEMLQDDILRMLKSDSGTEGLHKDNLSSSESGKELRKLISEQEKEMRVIHDKLKWSLEHESSLNSRLVLVCSILSVSLICGLYYLKRSQNRHKMKLENSEQRIMEIETTLSAQKVNAYLAEQNADGFMKEFNARFPDFVPSLSAQSDKITKNDLMICALIALGKGSETIQEIRHISRESLMAARYRIRKKLNLKHGERLETFLESIINQA